MGKLERPLVSQVQHKSLVFIRGLPARLKLQCNPEIQDSRLLEQVAPSPPNRRRLR